MKKKEIVSSVGYNYSAIKTTSGRVKKGLIAIPASLTESLPKQRGEIPVYLDDSSEATMLSFSPYQGTTRENRIGGLKKWFALHGLIGGEEIVLHLDAQEKVYRLQTDVNYVANIQNLQKQIDTAKNEGEVRKSLALLTQATNENSSENEFLRLSKEQESDRRYAGGNTTQKRESVPDSLRKILGDVYNGKCQLTGFTFLKENGAPYFEIHHIDENKGNFIKNLLVVSANIHRQFTYAKKEEFFEDGWLVFAKLADTDYSVNQFIKHLQYRKFIKTVYE